MSDTSRLNLTLLPTECFALIAGNYSLEGLIELAKNPTAPNAQDPMLFTNGKPLGLDSNALAKKLRLQPNEKKAVRTGALEVLKEHLQVLIQNNVRLTDKPDEHEPHLIVEQCLQEQQKEIATLRINYYDPIVATQRTKLDAAASIKSTYVGDLIAIDTLLNEVNMALIQPHLEIYEMGPKEQQQSLHLDGLGLTRLPEALIIKLQRYPRLTTLSVSFNQITSLPESFGNFKALVGLILSHNQITTLPDSFGNLVRLTWLNLSHNQLATLPDSFTKLLGLTFLNLSNNQLSTLPKFFGNFWSLTELDLSHNKVTCLPDSFGNLVKLTRFWIINNQLTTLPESFEKLALLIRLYLSKNKLTTLPESIQQILIHTNNEHLLALLPPVPVPMSAAIAATYTPSVSMKKQGQKRPAEEEEQLSPQIVPQQKRSQPTKG